MYYFEMPVEAEDVEYYRFFPMRPTLSDSFFFAFCSLLVLCKAYTYICRVCPSSKHYSLMCKVVTILLHFTDVFK